MGILNTNLSEIYALFLGSIDDGELAVVSAEEMEGVLVRYLVNCLPSLIEADFDVDAINFDTQDFGAKLGYEERSLVAKAMKLEWVREKRYSSDLMQKAIGDRDFTAVQGDKYLKELGSVEEQLQKEIREYIIRLSFKGFEGF